MLRAPMVAHVSHDIYNLLRRSSDHGLHAPESHIPNASPLRYSVGLCGLRSDQQRLNRAKSAKQEPYGLRKQRHSFCVDGAATPGPGILTV